jgi:hypothetical protein
MTYQDHMASADRLEREADAATVSGDYLRAVALLDEAMAACRKAMEAGHA